MSAKCTLPTKYAFTGQHDKCAVNLKVWENKSVTALLVPTLHYAVNIIISQEKRTEGCKPRTRQMLFFNLV